MDARKGGSRHDVLSPLFSLSPACLFSASRNWTTIGSLAASCQQFADQCEPRGGFIVARVLLAIGSNLGDPQDNLYQATSEIRKLPETHLLSRSSWHVTEPIGGPEGQAVFCNGALLIETELEPAVLSKQVHEVEAKLGRERRIRWEARLIDIDILLYDRLVLSREELVLPHPRMSFRRFVLEPAQEIAAEMIHSSGGWTLGQLLSHLASSRGSVLLCGDNGQLEGLKRLLVDAVGTELSVSVSCLPRISEESSTAEMSANQPPLAESNPALVINWDGADKNLEENEQTIRRRIHWNGPLAVLRGKSMEEVKAEAIAAVRAAFTH